MDVDLDDRLDMADILMFFKYANLFQLYDQQQSGYVYVKDFNQDLNNLTIKLTKLFIIYFKR